MTDPIKPRGMPPDVSPVEPRSTGARAPFSVDQAERATSAKAPGPDDDRVGALAAELRGGRIDSASAVENLIAHVRSQSGLPEGQRVELERFLRTALADDPALADLMKDLRRGV